MLHLISLFLVWDFAKEKWKDKEIGDNKKSKKIYAHIHTCQEIFPIFQTFAFILRASKKENLGLLIPIKEN